MLQNTPALATTTWATLHKAIGDKQGTSRRIMAWTLRQPKIDGGVNNPFSHLLMARRTAATDEQVLQLQRAAKQLGAVQWQVPTTQRAVPTDDRPFLFLANQVVPTHVPIAIILTLLALLWLLWRTWRQRQPLRWPLVGFAAGAAAMSVQVLAVHCGQLTLDDPATAWAWSLAAVLGGSAVGAPLLLRLTAAPKEPWQATTLAIIGALLMLTVHDVWLGDFTGSSWALAAVAVAAMPIGLPFLWAISGASDSHLHEGVVIAADGLGAILGAALTMFVLLHFGFSALWWFIPALFALAALCSRGD